MKRPDSFKRLVITYIVGFLGSLILSLLSFLIVVNGVFESASTAAIIILLLATLQLIVQAVCFLHLGPDNQPFSRTGTFIFTILMMLVIVIGSIWIMNNLDYRMNTSSEAMRDYMLEQNKKGF